MSRLLAVSLTLSVSLMQAHAGTVEITFQGLTSDDGKMMVAFFQGPKGFPTKTQHAVELRTSAIEGGRSTLSIDLPAGTYAISGFHDANDDGKLNIKWLVLPAEGLGSSNNAKGRMGPPSYEDAAFDVPAEGTVTQVIDVVYL